MLSVWQDYFRASIYYSLTSKRKKRPGKEQASIGTGSATTNQTEVEQMLNNQADRQRVARPPKTRTGAGAPRCISRRCVQNGSTWSRQPNPELFQGNQISISVVPNNGPTNGPTYGTTNGTTNCPTNGTTYGTTNEATDVTTTHPPTHIRPPTHTLADLAI